MKIIYSNGDSNMAGTELGDFLLPNWPGVLDWPAPMYLHEAAKIDESVKKALPEIERMKEICRTWFWDSHNDLTELGKLRLAKSNEIDFHEKKNSVSGQLAELLDCTVFNHSKAGASMEHIVSSTIFDLTRLLVDNDPEDIVAVIGNTFPSRFMYPKYELDNDHYNRNSYLYFYDNFSPATKVNKQNKNILQYIIEHTDFRHILLSYATQLNILDSFCKHKNIKLYFIDTMIKNELSELLIELENSIVDARDGARHVFIELLQYINLAIPSVPVFASMEQLALIHRKEVYSCFGHYSSKVHGILAQDIQADLTSSMVTNNRPAIFEKVEVNNDSLDQQESRLKEKLEKLRQADPFIYR